MFEIFMNSIYLFLIVYAIIEIVKKAVSWFLYDRKNDNDSNNVYTVITVKNKESTIEGLVRSVVWQQLNNQNGGHLPKILIVDFDSTDETLPIIKKLAKDYSFIRAIDKSTYMDIIGKKYAE